MCALADDGTLLFAGERRISPLPECKRVRVLGLEPVPPFSPLPVTAYGVGEGGVVIQWGERRDGVRRACVLALGLRCNV